MGIRNYATIKNEWDEESIPVLDDFDVQSLIIVPRILGELRIALGEARNLLQFAEGTKFLNKNVYY